VGTLAPLFAAAAAFFCAAFFLLASETMAGWLRGRWRRCGVPPGREKKEEGWYWWIGGSAFLPETSSYFDLAQIVDTCLPFFSWCRNSDGPNYSLRL
jgi:hypothetical protein